MIEETHLQKAKEAIWQKVVKEGKFKLVEEYDDKTKDDKIVVPETPFFNVLHPHPFLSLFPLLSLCRFAAQEHVLVCDSCVACATLHLLCFYFASTLLLLCIYFASTLHLLCFYFASTLLLLCFYLRWLDLM